MAVPGPVRRELKYCDNVIAISLNEASSIHQRQI